MKGHNKQNCRTLEDVYGHGSSGGVFVSAVAS